MNNYNPDYFEKKSTELTSAGMGLIDVYCGILYNVRYNNLEQLIALKNSGFVMLVKHQSAMDILLESNLLNRINRQGHYIMKYGLRGFLEYLGGIPIMRPKDISPAGIGALKNARENRNKVYEYDVLNLLCRNEIIVVHPECERNFKTIGKIDKRVLRRVLGLQSKVYEQTGNPILWLPVGIEYNSSTLIPFSGIDVNVGKPISVEDSGIDELAEHLVSQINLVRL